MPTSITYGKSKIAYRQFGHGDRLLIGIHGFADRSSAFEQLIPVLSEHFTVICFDLPFHGETIWSRGRFTRQELADVIRLILEKTGHKRFSLMGHSMGGRIILNLVPIFPKEVEAVFLFAPAGLRQRLIYWKEFLPLWLRKWARRKLVLREKPPRWFFWLKNAGLLPKYAAGLVEVHFTSLHRRRRMLNTFVSMYDFDINPSKQKKCLEKNNIPIYLYMGEFDKAVPASDGTSFAKNLSTATLRILPENHFVMTSKLSEVLGEDLKGLWG